MAEPRPVDAAGYALERRAHEVCPACNHVVLYRPGDPSSLTECLVCGYESPGLEDRWVRVGSVVALP